MNLPLLYTIGLLLVYLIISYFYIKAIYLSTNKNAETIKKIKRLYSIVTFIFAFLIVSKFAVEQSIKDLNFGSDFIINSLVKPIIEQKTLTLEIILSLTVFVIYLLVLIYCIIPK